GPDSGSDHRIVRGGGWGIRAQHCRSAFRGSYPPDTQSKSLGFRLALVPVQ
ncbi:MAG: SUMF1/EgtB/PvdO family nonheme iron enzyme, partial [Lentisphaeria bacterium]|nr:SUMF1/EgtB/PvdO family nonheme iron enzyme [Lentisphaeria bacterium]